MARPDFAPTLFAGRVALVTGGGTGIGLATARLLARLGARTVLVGRRRDVLEHAASTLQHDAVVAPCDIRDSDAVDATVSDVVKRCGRIDVLVNNAGGQFVAPAEAISPNGFMAVVRSNLAGPFHMTRAVARAAFFPQEGGAVVNVTMQHAHGTPGMAHSGAARAGVENLTRTLALEWAGRGVRVNAVAPGIIATEGLQQYPPELVDMSRRGIPLQRLGSAEEVAYAIAFLASDLAAFITGTTLAIDGGPMQLTAWPAASR